MQAKHNAFADALALSAEQMGMSGAGAGDTNSFIASARRGLYAGRRMRPAFVYVYFGITEEEYNALWTLIYG